MATSGSLVVLELWLAPLAVRGQTLLDVVLRGVAGQPPDRLAQTEGIAERQPLAADRDLFRRLHRSGL